ncbi:MAG: hypothetical protein AAGE96_23130 [Cyanobacteria bacterium P01_G01_bin.19]
MGKTRENKLIFAINNQELHPQGANCDRDFLANCAIANADQNKLM